MHTNANITTDRSAKISAMEKAAAFTARSVLVPSAEIFFSVMPRKNAPMKTVGVMYLKFIVQVKG